MVIRPVRIEVEGAPGAIIWRIQIQERPGKLAAHTPEGFQRVNADEMNAGLRRSDSGYPVYEVWSVKARVDLPGAGLVLPPGSLRR